LNRSSTIQTPTKIAIGSRLSYQKDWKDRVDDDDDEKQEKLHMKG
jgi:hypothetical protein